MSVKSGLDALIEQQFAPLAGKRVGLLTNPSAVTRDLVSAYDVFRRAPHLQLAALFSPEHGFAAVAADGEQVASSTDSQTGVPIHSLYGASLRPTRAMFDGLDVLVCDIQDIGVRYYTFAWTIMMAIEAAGEQGSDVLLLDRPNPLGDTIDGAPVAAGYASIVGYAPVPTQHGMTLGELARMFNGRWNPTPAALDVQPCVGYQRNMTWEQTSLPFVPPSPAMPHISTVRHYPGACLLEGTNISEGRGTALPFEICGAPFVDAAALAEHLNALELADVRFRPHSFKPTASKYAGEVCHGVQAHIIGAGFRPLLAWVAAISVLRHLYAGRWQWLPPYPGSPHLPFDRLAGSARLREQIDANVPLAELAAEWDAAASTFRAERQEYLLYG
jgi:uncharacterized protein YbbC (DUF1343 family)